MPLATGSSATTGSAVSLHISSNQPPENGFETTLSNLSGPIETATGNPLDTTTYTRMRDKFKTDKDIVEDLQKLFNEDSVLTQKLLAEIDAGNLSIETINSNIASGGKFYIRTEEVIKQYYDIAVKFSKEISREWPELHPEYKDIIIHKLKMSYHSILSFKTALEVMYKQPAAIYLTKIMDTEKTQTIHNFSSFTQALKAAYKQPVSLSLMKIMKPKKVQEMSEKDKQEFKRIIDGTMGLLGKMTRALIQMEGKFQDPLGIIEDKFEIPVP
jgi:hypothetical protein